MKLDLAKEIDRKKYETYSNKLLSNRSQVELRKIMPVRTLKHNSFLHVVIDIYAINFGYTSDESKTFLKRNCGFMVYEKNGSKFLKKTSNMEDKELSPFIDWIRNLSAKNGHYIPNPEEYLSNKFNIDKEINNYKQYL